MEEGQQAEVSIPGAPPDSDRTPPADHFDTTLFVLLAAVLALIVWSNIWLRRRAERQREEEPTRGSTP